METATLGISILLLATLVEGFTEYVFSDAADHVGFGIGLKYAPLALGVIVAVLYQVDILASLGVTSSVPYAGYVVSGLIIGRGSNYVNDIISKFRS